MKKVLFSMFFPVLAVVTLAANAPNNNIFIQGTGINQAQYDFFIENFRMEGAASGYNIVDDPANAAHTFRFQVRPNMIVYDDGSQAPAPPEEGRYIIMIFLVRNSDEAEIAAFGFAFTELHEMYDYTQFMFLRAVANIPRDSSSPVIITQDHGRDVIVQEIDGREVHFVVQESDDWRNKWLYFRVSLDYPIRIYTLKQDSSTLVGGVAVYDGDFRSPTRISPLDNLFIALPGFTLGLEFQFLNFMSLEPLFHISMGDPEKVLFFNMSAGGQLKFPIKTMNNVVIAPYGAFLYPLNKSSVFSEFPRFSIGGGIQLAIKGGESGAFFFDLNYMQYLDDVVMHNPHGALFPKPEVINYRHFAIGIGIGYKYGLFDRK